MMKKDMELLKILNGLENDYMGYAKQIKAQDLGNIVDAAMFTYSFGTHDMPHHKKSQA